MEVAFVGDLTEGAGNMGKALEGHGYKVVLMPDNPRPRLTIVPNKMEEHFVTTHAVTAELASRKGKLIQWILESAFSPITALEPGQVVSDQNDTRVEFFLKNVGSLEFATFKALLVETRRPSSMRYDISEDAWNDAKKCLLAELVVHRE